jgi:ribosomal protein S18 acetylase RimI-like enzyme
MRIRKYGIADRNQLISLWQECGLVNPKNDPEKDIERKLKVRPDWLLVGEEKGIIVASVMVGYEGHRGWINYLAVKPVFQSNGFGKMIMEKAEKVLKKAGCPKINLQVRKENRKVLNFYEKLGYAEDKVISLGKRLRDDSEKPAQRKSKR